MSDEAEAKDLVDGRSNTSVNEGESPDSEAMRVAARALGRARSSGARSSQHRPRGKTTGSSRDPELVGAAVSEFLTEQGWQGSTAMAQLAESWAEIVGPEVAAHVAVESWTEGDLVLRADSTAWATQVRLLSDSLKRQVSQAVGEDLVRTITVKGPDAPSWRAGPRVVKGRGPRDTYG